MIETNSGSGGANRTPVVMKFGGTSVRDAEAMRRVVSIVTAESGGRAVVVTSACAGVTDMLLACARCCADSRLDDALGLVAALRERHLAIASELCPSDDDCRDALVAMLEEIERLVRGVVLLGELSPRSTDQFASYGERLSSILLTAAFRADGGRAALADSRAFIITDDAFTCAAPIMARIDEAAGPYLLPMLDAHDVVITQGFIGATVEGVTTTIGRGGSDYTGALAGAALRAREIQIWTDVSGILTADPRVVPTARVVPEVTFTEARELAFFGAKVIHPDTILPAVERAIPVVIRNSMRPADPGTRILPDGTPLPPALHSITVKRNVTAVSLAPLDPRDGLGPVEHAMGLFAEHGAEIYSAMLAESRAVAAVPTDRLNDVLRTALAASCRVEERDGMALLSITGAGLLEHPALIAEPLAALGTVPIVFAGAGTSDHLLLVGIPEDRAAEALAAVHARLFEG